ncbi:TRAP transporter substrate-binding protein [Brevibacillus sp. B_LB10_24]|uniref:TRAP transporter substrate-binding protein n=1 Tax=Brevibacillus sp. B_LB10_24 TaxID=3380645 RepID=UPI0038BBA0F5
MKYRRHMLGLFSALFLLAGCSSSEGTSGATGSTGKVYELNLNVSAGPVHPFTKNVAEPWAEMVEKETNGIVKVNVHPSAALGQLSSAYEDIKSGVYEAGQVSPGRHVDTDIFPLTIGDIPFLIESPAVAEKVLTNFVHKYMQDVFVEGTFMSISATDSFQVYSRKPIHTVADLQNMKIADTAAERIALLKELGSVPVSINNTELYESLERGIVDGVAYTSVGANGYKLDEVAPYMTKISLGATNLMFMINTDFLESLPEDIRKMFIEKFGPEYSHLVTKLYTEKAAEAITTFEDKVKAKGGEVITPTEEEMKAFKAPVKKIMEEWVQKANKRGYPGQEMMDYFTSQLKAEGVAIPE